MKLNVFKILEAVTIGMQFAEQFKGTKTGKEKLELALDKADDFVVLAEGIVGKDLLKEPEIRPLVEDYIAAGVRLKNAVERTKALKASPMP